MLDGAGDSGGVEILAGVEALEDEQLGAIDMIRPERGVRRSPRQTNRAAGDICDIGIVAISLNDPANVADIVREACDDEICIIFRCRWPQHRPSDEDVM